MVDLAADFIALLKLFDKHEVKYCVVGAFAVAFHAIPRYTKDLDLLVEPDLENGRRIVSGLREFGFSSLKLSAQDFARPGCTIQLGYEPVRIDLITSIEGCAFPQVWKGKVRGSFGPLTVNYIGRADLIKNKRAADRDRDREDLRLLQRPGKRRR